MVHVVARYDLRCPDLSPHTRPELYEACLDQAAYADEHGLDGIVLSEHHSVPDGYLPSPVTLAAAVAARTRRIGVTVAALLVPLYDPVRLAEDLVVLDHVSRGRVSYVAGLGYRREEYEALGHDWSSRGERMEHCLEVLHRAWTGEPFDHDGRSVRVTPEPFSDPHPLLMYGGGSPAAARRAARHGLGFFPQHADPQLAEIYEEERRRLGTPGFVVTPPEQTGTFFVAEDPEAFWAAAGDHLLYEAREYARWQEGQSSAVHDTSTTVEEMREAGVYRVVTPDELVAIASGLGPNGAITTHPLIAGLPLDLSWESLRLLCEAVLPRLE